MKEIPLTKSQIALVDVEDYEFLMQWKWSVVKSKNTYYATRWIKGNYHLLMHRVILGLTNPKRFCDHRDHNGLNNQKYNLRIATRKQNGHNKNSSKNSSSKYLGVCFHKANSVWCAQITVNGRRMYLGSYKTEIEAAIAYDAMAIKHFGEFSNPNFK